MALDRRTVICSLALAGLGAPRLAIAQSYPARPITMIVPFAPGGLSDVFARLIVDHLRGTLGQPIVIENPSGAAGSTGTGRVARATPDGYTVVLGYWGTHVANAAVYPLTYDVVTDFEPIARLPGQPLFVVGKRDLPANNLMEFVAWLKANPDKGLQATAGVGSAGHVVGLLFQRQTGTRFRFVPYRGTAPLTQALVAGEIDFAFNNPLTVLPHVREGLLKAFAITADTRLELAPEVPTVDEAGLPGLHFSLWQGLWAPRGTPQEIILKLNRAITLALAEPSIRRALAAQAFDVVPEREQTPEALGALQRAQMEKWLPIIRSINVN